MDNKLIKFVEKIESDKELIKTIMSIDSDEEILKKIYLLPNVGRLINRIDNNICL